MSKKEHKETKEIVSVILPHKEDGWFCFTEYEIPLDLLTKEGKIKSKINPDVFQSFLSQLTERCRNILGI